MRQKTPVAVKRLALERVSEGEPVKDVAADLGLGVETIRCWMRKLGIPPPRVVTSLPPTPKQLAALARRKAGPKGTPAVARYDGDEEDEGDPAPDEGDPGVELGGEDDVDEDGDLTTLEEARAMMKAARRIARAAAELGNHTAAQRAIRDALQAAVVVSRIERAMKDSGDGIFIPKANLRKAMHSLHEKARVLCDRPLLCAHCHRALMVAWGTALELPPAAAGGSKGAAGGDDSSAVPQ